MPRHVCVCASAFLSVPPSLSLSLSAPAGLPSVCAGVFIPTDGWIDGSIDQDHHFYDGWLAGWRLGQPDGKTNEEGIGIVCMLQ
mmetsp:Transcript_50341/g.126116  ORF Transcript_50341/g.126116 Transcript_50341/m.126116 type:complete len:84 (+) Transcript_50341:388-639(+)